MKKYVIKNTSLKNVIKIIYLSTRRNLSHLRLNKKKLKILILKTFINNYYDDIHTLCIIISMIRF